MRFRLGMKNYSQKTVTSSKLAISARSPSSGRFGHLLPQCCRHSPHLGLAHPEVEPSGFAKPPRLVVFRQHCSGALWQHCRLSATFVASNPPSVRLGVEQIRQSPGIRGGIGPLRRSLRSQFEKARPLLRFVQLQVALLLGARLAPVPVRAQRRAKRSRI